MIELDKLITKSILAKRMGIYPQTLNNKLKGDNGVFSKEDAEKVISILEEVLEKTKDQLLNLNK